jgi:hypothetical protein
MNFKRIFDANLKSIFRLVNNLLKTLGLSFEKISQRLASRIYGKPLPSKQTPPIYQFVIKKKAS